MVPCYKLAVPTLGKHETHFSSPCSLNIDSVMYIATYVLYPQPTFRHKMAVEYINHTLFLTVHHNHIKIDLSNQYLHTDFWLVLSLISQLFVTY